MKRVLIFSTAYYPLASGAEVAIKEITDRFDPTKWQFDMITLRFDSGLPKVEKIGNVTVYRVGFTKKDPTMEELVHFPMYLVKVLYPPFVFFKALSLRMKNRYDLSWAMMSYAAFPITFLKLVGWRTPYVLTLQEGDPIDYITGRARIRLVYPFYKLIFHFADVVQVISNYLGDFARYMGYKKKIAVIPNGVDYEKFSKAIAPERRGEVRQRFGTEPNLFLLVTTSRLVPKNGYEDILAALALLPRHIKFLAIGDGPDEAKLKKLAAELKIEDRVFFLGRLGHNEIAELQKSSDVFIRPSLTEGQGVSFIEAMASGIPIIATPVGGIVDFLFDRKTGMFCKVKDPQSIAEKVLEIESNKELYDSIVSNSLKMVNERYHWSRIAGEMKEVFEEAMRKNS